MTTGDRVIHRYSGRKGTILSDPRPVGSAGGALFVRVEWDGPFARSESREAVFRLRTLGPNDEDAGEDT